MNWFITARVPGNFLSHWFITSMVLISFVGWLALDLLVPIALVRLLGGFLDLTTCGSGLAKVEFNLLKVPIAMKPVLLVDCA